MILTGSIGFHLVLRQLDSSGYRNRPLNDVHSERVPMLEPSARQELASALLRGIGHEPQPAVVNALARVSEGHPYVMQHLVDHLRGRVSFDVQDVERALEQLLTPPSVLDLAHYATRLETYYGQSCAPAKAILDLLARESHGMAVDELAAGTGLERGEVVEVLRLLRDDDYVEVDGTAIRFGLDLVRRYWARDRLLS